MNIRAEVARIRAALAAVGGGEREPCPLCGVRHALQGVVEVLVRTREDVTADPGTLPRRCPVAGSLWRDPS